LLTKALPLLLLAACAATVPLPTTEQPELALLLQSYAPQLRAVGITRLISPGMGAMVRLETYHGPVYVRYPAGVADVAFDAGIYPEGLQVTAATFSKDQYAPLLAALVPEAVRVTAANNSLEWIRANPWN
jgi:hypothetical protein